MECDDQYIKGEKSMGYRLLEYRHATHRLIDLDNPTIKANVIKRHLNMTAKAVHKWLYENLPRVTVDEAALGGGRAIGRYRREEGSLHRVNPGHH